MLCNFRNLPYGKNSIAAAVFKLHPKEAFLVSIAKSNVTGNYTGLILNCSTVNIIEAMSPLIVTENRTVYSYDNIERNILL